MRLAASPSEAMRDLRAGSRRRAGVDSFSNIDGVRRPHYKRASQRVLLRAGGFDVVTGSRRPCPAPTGSSPYRSGADTARRAACCERLDRHDTLSGNPRFQLDTEGCSMPTFAGQAR